MHGITFNSKVDQTQNRSDTSNAEVAVVSTTSDKKRSIFRFEGMIGKQHCEVLLDTGAEVSVISDNLAPISR